MLRALIVAALVLCTPALTWYRRGLKLRIGPISILVWRAGA